MNDYGDPIYDKSNNLIGYKLNETEFATITSYYNKDNLLCNKVSIRDFSDLNIDNLNLNYEPLIS